eukprot:gene10513-3035_t
MDIKQFISILNSALSPDSTIIKKSEAMIEEMSNSSGFYIYLAQILLNSEFDLYLRQLSGVILKKYIKTKWNETFNQKPIISDKDKSILRENLPRGLVDKSTKIMTTVSLVISEISSFDFPENWPNLLSGLLDLFTKSEPNSVAAYGSIKCLSLVAEHFNDTQISIVFPQLVPFMNKINKNMNYPSNIREKGLIVNYWLYQLLLLKFDDEKEICLKLLNLVLPESMEILLMIIKTSSEKTSRGLKKESFKILEVLVKNIPKEIKKYSKEILTCVFESMIEEYKLYYQYNIIESKEEEDNFDEELGESLKLNNLIIQQLELIATIIGTSIFKSLIQPNCERIIQISILYSQFTKEEEEIWEDDPNTFISQNDEESLALTVRLLSQEIIQEIIEIYDGSYQFVFKHLISNFKECEEKKKKKEKDWWKLRECSLFCLGSISKVISNNINIEGLIKIIIEKDLSNDQSNDYLKSTCIWFLSKFIENQNQNLKEIYLKISTIYLDEKYSIPIRINSCRCLSRVFSKIPSNIIEPFLFKIFNGISKLFDITNEDTIHIIIESLDILISKHPNSLKYSNNNFLINLLKTLQLYSKDQLIKIDILYVFESIVHIGSNKSGSSKSSGSGSGSINEIESIGLEIINPNLFKELIESIIPLITKVIQFHEQQELTLIDSCIELLGIIIDGFGQKRLNYILDILKISFIPLLNLLKYTQEDNLLQSGTETLRAIIHVSYEILPKLNFNNSNALQLILEFISKMLSTSSDSACVYLSSLVIELIKKFNTILKDILPNILRVILERLYKSKNITLNRTFIILFSTLIISDTNNSLSFLSNFKINQISSLEILCKNWIQLHGMMITNYHLKISSIAFIKLILSNDSNLSFNIEIERIIQKNQSKRITRSNTQKIIEKVPFVVKIFQLLVSTLLRIIEDSKNKISFYSNDGNDDDDDDDEYESDDDQFEFNNGVGGGVSDFKFDDELRSIFQEAEDSDEDEDGFTDPYAKDDEIYHLDLQTSLKDGIIEIFQKQKSLVELSLTILNEKEKKLLQDILK